MHRHDPSRGAIRGAGAGTRRSQPPTKWQPSGGTPASLFGVNQSQADSQAGRRSCRSARQRRRAAVLVAWVLALLGHGAAARGVLAAAGPGAPASRAAPAPPLVLVLYSGHSLLPANTIFDASFRQSLGSDSTGAVESCSEFLDEVRFPAGFPERVRNSLQAKFAERAPDAIVAVAPPSLDFCLRQRAQLFPQVPIVFAALGPEMASSPERAPRITGVRSSFDGPATLRLALRLHPRTQQVFIIADPAAADSTNKNTGWPVFPESEFHTTFHRLTGLPLPALMERLGSLPDNSLVIDLSMFGTTNGNPSPPQLVAERMALASRAPIYSAFDPFVGYGFVGAVTTPMDEIGREAAALVGEILARPNADELPAVRTLAATPIFDWRQLRRWGIRQSQLPAGRIVRFEPPSFWRQNFALVMFVTGIILLQSGLILALVIQSRRRRWAEREAQRRRDELAHMTRVATMGELTASLAHEINQPLAAILSNAQAALRLLAAGDARAEEIREILADIAADDQRAGEVIRRMRALLRKGESNPMTLGVNDLVHEVVGLVRGEMLLQNVSLGLEPGHRSAARARGPDPAAAGASQPDDQRAGCHEGDHGWRAPGRGAHRRGGPPIRARVGGGFRRGRPGRQARGSVRTVRHYQAAWHGAGAGHLPLHHPGTRGEDRRPEQSRTGSHLLVHAPGSRGRKALSATEPCVFVVDDEATVRKSLGRLLKAAGYRVETFASAREFLQRPADNAIACLVLDVQMPELNGMELQQALTDTNRVLPIVFITGHGDIPTSVRAMKAGATDFLSKPFDEKDLLEAIQRALEQAEQQSVERAAARRGAAAARHSDAARARGLVAGAHGPPEQADRRRAGRRREDHQSASGRVMQKMQAQSVADLVRLCEKAGIRVP